MLKQNIPLKENERIDDLQRNGYGIIQDSERFCFGMDAVLLSGFAVVKEGARVLDLGTGTGIIPILLEAKTALSVEVLPISSGMLCGWIRTGKNPMHIMQLMRC